MKTVTLGVRIEEQEYQALQKAITFMEPELGNGATTSNVLVLMIRAFVRATSNGHKPALPFECKTINDDQSARIAAESKPTWGPSSAPASVPGVGPGAPARRPRPPTVKSKVG